MIDDAQRAMREREQLKQAQQTTDSNPASKPRRKKPIKRLNKEPVRTMYDDMIEDAQKEMREQARLIELQQQADEGAFDNQIS